LQSNTVQFLSVDEVLEIHARLIVRFGGADGLRDKGFGKARFTVRRRAITQIWLKWLLPYLNLS